MPEEDRKSPELYVEGIEGLEPKPINGIRSRQTVNKELLDRIDRLEAVIKEEKNNLHVKAKEETARFEAKVIEELILLESKVKEEMQNLDIKTKEQVDRLEEKVKEEVQHLEDRTHELTEKIEIANSELEPVLGGRESSFLNLRKSILVGLPVVLLLVVLGLMSGISQPIVSPGLNRSAALPPEEVTLESSDEFDLVIPESLDVTDLAYDGELLTASVSLGSAPQSKHAFRIIGMEVISELKRKYPNQDLNIVFTVGRLRPTNYAEINYLSEGNKINFNFI